MAWQSNVNIGPTDADEGVFELKEHMKANGCTLEGSGDGDSNFDNSGTDVITGPGTGANGIANSNAWWRIKMPDGVRELLFERTSTGAGSWTYYYSVSAGFTGGTPGANQRPTASDEQVIANFTTNATCYFHMAIQDAATGGFYSWWFVGREEINGSAESFAYGEALSQARSDDSDPCVHGALSSTVGTAQLDDTTPNRPPMGYYDYGGPDEQFVTWTAAYPDNQRGGAVKSIGADEDGNDTLIPIPMYRVSPSGVKGFMAHHGWIGSARSYPDIIDTGSDVYLVIDDVAVQGWPNTTTAPGI